MGEIESTEGVEQLTWYRDGRESPAQIRVTYPNRRIELSDEKAAIMDAEPGALSPGTVEMLGGRNESYAIMGIRSPEELLEMAETLALAADFWSHEIQECECFEPEDDADVSMSIDGEMPEGMEIKELPGGGLMISMSAPLSEIFGVSSESEPSPVPDQD